MWTRIVLPTTIYAVLFLGIAVLLSESAENIPTTTWEHGGEVAETRVQQGKGGQKQGQTKNSHIPVTADTCPVLKKASCVPKNNGTECVCPGLAKANTTKTARYRGGVYSCPNSTCAYCTSTGKACRPDNIEFACCPKSNYGCYQAMPGKLNSEYFCLSSCNRNRQYQTCKDPATGEVVPGDFTRCNGSTPMTLTICTDHYSFSKPVECGTLGGKCDYFKDRYDTCCSPSQTCKINGTCAAFCGVSKDSTCGKRSDHYRCKGENALFVNCTGVKYPGRFLACRGADAKAKNTLFECAGTAEYYPPRECGTTGAKCQVDLTMARSDPCCTGFSCVKGKCEEECKGGAAGCKINTYKSTCGDADSVKNSFISCPLNGVTYSAQYLSCNGSEPNVWIECPSFPNQSRQRECGVTGLVCDPRYQKSQCCTKFKCSNSTMKCEPGN